MARIIGAYIPYVLEPNIYLAILTMVASIVIVTNKSSVCSDTPFSKIHNVSGE